MNLIQKGKNRVVRAKIGVLIVLMMGLISLAGCSKSQESSASTAVPKAPVTVVGSDLSTLLDANPMVRGGLVSATFLVTVPANTTQLVLQYLVTNQIFDPALLNAPTYGVNSYKIRYKTVDVAGNLVTASGLLTLPIKSPDALSPLLSYQHGTLFLERSAPSHDYNYTSGPVLSASLGYIVASPDYLGYGDSASLPHPYSHSKTLASSSIDLLRAVKTFLQDNAVGLNDQLFLIGYSEGGKATLAMQREMETNLSAEFQVTVSTAGAGNYDMSATMADYLNRTTLDAPEYLAWVLKSYDEIYQLNRLDYIVMPSYLSAVSSNFDGLSTGTEIRAALTSDAAALINPQFVLDYLAGGEVAFTAALADNDDYDWTPTAPTYLFHGRDDRLVPYFNSQNAYQTMIQNGSTSVQLVECDAGALPANHENCIYPYANYSYGLFATYAQDL